MRHALLLPMLFALLASSLPASAQVPRAEMPAAPVSAVPPADQAQQPDTVAPPDGVRQVVDMDTVVVSGLQPGPGMWKVRKGDNVLYVLGTLTPLPRRMEWNSATVESVIARSQAVIDPPYLNVGTGMGVLRSLTLVPSALRARRNPDGGTLEEAVGPELYARWTLLKPRYLGRDRGVESWRPIFAAQKLYEGAIERSGLDQRNIVTKVVASAARRHDVPRVSTRVEFQVEDPKALLREFADTTLADTDCFARTLSRIETDIDAMRARANAWAVGDVGLLQTLPLHDQYAACMSALSGSAIGKRAGIHDARVLMTTKWLQAADQALAENAMTFASVPLQVLLRKGGFLDRLRERGYVIEAPANADGATPLAADPPRPPAATAPAPASAGGGAGTRKDGARE
jgi:hypothetical protein